MSMQILGDVSDEISIWQIPVLITLSPETNFMLLLVNKNIFHNKCKCRHVFF